MKSGNNRKRILAEVLSLDAWHDPFVDHSGSLGVFVEVSFLQGRIGGDTGDLPFTFKIGLKKALLTVSVERPLEIDRKSIARSIPEANVELTKILAAKRSAEDKISASGKLSPAALHVALNGEIKTVEEVSQSDQVRIVQTVPQTLVVPQPTDSFSYSWAMEPAWSPLLEGQPWHPIDQPRLRIKPVSALNAALSAIKVEVRCALEDVSITDIRRKKIDSVDRAINLIHPINEAAAQQHLKLLLRDADLEPGQLDNRFSTIILASVLASEE